MMEPPPPYERTPSLTSSASISTRMSALDMEITQGERLQLTRRDRFKLMMPRMHMYMAATCAVVNFIIPGFGTILAAFSLFFCCTKKSDLTSADIFYTFSIGLIIGLLQILLVPVFLIGWVWSAIWGLAMIGVSDEKYHGNTSDESDYSSGSLSGLSLPSASHVHLSRSSSINSSIGPNSFPFEAIYASTANIPITEQRENLEVLEMNVIPNTPPPPYDRSTIAEVST